MINAVKPIGDPFRDKGTTKLLAGLKSYQLPSIVEESVVRGVPGVPMAPAYTPSSPEAQ